MDTICFDKVTFTMYLSILISILVYIGYYYFSLCKDNMDATLLNNTIENALSQLTNTLKDNQLSSNSNSDKPNRFVNKIYNPLESPERIYPGGSFTEPGYDGYTQNQMIGYINGPGGHFPLFGRFHDPSRMDRWDYYTMPDTRNKIKIPLKTKNHSELYDDDSLTIPELGGTFTVKIYEKQGNRYNPNIY